jgi:aminopeptidase-like protein
MTAVEAERPDPGVEAAELERLFDRLFPLMRSITGEGVRQTGTILSEAIPLDVIEIPSGTDVFDWTVPPEWIFRDAYVIGPDGEKRFDARENTLRILNYSAPFRGVLSREELDAHLYSLADEPDAIPYLTSYYRREWGFCLSQRERDALPEGDYQVVVDTGLDETGSMTLFESVLPGVSPQEILISVNICHPSLANNELYRKLAITSIYIPVSVRTGNDRCHRLSRAKW